MGEGPGLMVGYSGEGGVKGYVQKIGHLGTFVKEKVHLKVYLYVAAESHYDRDYKSTTTFGGWVKKLRHPHHW